MDEKPKTKTLAVRQTTYALTNPAQVSVVAKKLQDFLKKNELLVNIQGKNYAMTEGWQFAGGMFGLVPKVVKVENMSTDNEVRWMAHVEITNIKTKEVVGNGFAICSNKEGKKKSFDEYAVLSMAQTRAIGKAYRNLIGWVVKMAGYETTPAEEMPPTQPNKMEATIENTIAMIRAAKQRAPLMVALKKIEGSKGYTPEQKALLKSEISARLDIIDNAK